MQSPKFPELSANQVALIRAEFSTGVILDGRFNKHISSEQIFHSVFDCYEDAVEYIQFVSRNDLEFIVYNHKQQVLLYHQPSFNKK